MEKPLNLAKALLINKPSSRRIVAHWFDISWSVCLSRGSWRGRDRPCRWWRNHSHPCSVANERGITTRWRLIAPLFRNHNGWLHSDVIRTWLRWAGGCSATLPTCFYWIVLHWLSDDDMLYCSLMHICKALIHKPGAADSKNLIAEERCDTLSLKLHRECGVKLQFDWIIVFICCFYLLTRITSWRMAAALIEYRKKTRPGISFSG